MGITIFYKGKLKSPHLISPLLNELEALCSELNWNYDPFSDADLNLNGANLRLHPQAEPLGFFFHPDGQLVNLMAAILEKENPSKPLMEDVNINPLQVCWCKTQFAGPVVHKMIGELLIYLQKKYFATLEITDEGGYYPNKDEKELLKRMQFLDTMMDALCSLLEGGEIPPDLLENQKAQLQEAHRELLMLLRFLGRYPYLKETN